MRMRKLWRPILGDTAGGRPRTPDIGDRLCSARVVFDLVVQDELGAGVAGLGRVELGAEGGDGAGSARGGERVEPDGQGFAAGDDVAANDLQFWGLLLPCRGSRGA